MNLVKKILIGAAISSLPLLASAQLNIKKLEKENKISSILDLKNLGHNYFMKRNGNSLTDKSYNQLRELDSYNQGSFYLENNGKRILSKGTLSGNISKNTLEKIDSIEKDNFISEEEISQAYSKLLYDSFLDYASKKLSNEGEFILNQEGYIFSKDSEETLNLLTEVYNPHFGKSKSDFYNLLSGEDKVITDKEVKSAAKALYETLFKK